MLIYLLPAFLSSDAKASTAGGFYSLSITPIPVPIPRTAQLPEVVTLEVPKAWEGNTGVQELNLRERAGTVGLGVGLSSCHNTGTSVGTVSLFPACWDAFKKPQPGGFQNQTCLIPWVLPAGSSGVMCTLYVNTEPVTGAGMSIKD